MPDTFNPEFHLSEADVMKKMEDEYQRLQRQVRVIQRDHDETKTGVHPQFRRSDSLLRVLKAEYGNLKKDLKISQTGRHKKYDKRMKRELKRSILQMVKTQKEAEDGIIMMKQLEDLLQRKNKAMMELKKAVSATVGELNRRRHQSEQRLNSTENRLETNQKRFNTIQSENVKIRAEIEHMLKDRALFNQSWKKMLIALGKGKKFLTDLFESSTLAYNQRDEWCAKLKNLQEKGKLDQMTQIQEMRDLQKALDHEAKLFDFLAVKGIMRINREQEEREENEKMQKEEDLQVEVRKHIRILDDIMEYTGEENFTKILKEFEKREQENFSLYTFVVECCAENVMLGKELAKSRRDADERHDWNERKEENMEKTLKDLEQELEHQRRKTGRLRRQVADQDQQLEKAMGAIEEMFKTLGCSLEPFQNLLGDKSPTLRKANLTFQCINEKIKEYMECAYFYERQIVKKPGRTTPTSKLKMYTVYPDRQRTFNAIPLRFIVPSDPCPACIEARWLSRVSDTMEKPFSKKDTMAAIRELSADPSYVRSDRIHSIVDCRAPRSRVLLAAQYAQK